MTPAQILSAITAIADAQAPGSITNEMVAAILRDLLSYAQATASDLTTYTRGADTALARLQDDIDLLTSDYNLHRAASARNFDAQDTRLSDLEDDTIPALSARLDDTRREAAANERDNLATHRTLTDRLDTKATPAQAFDTLWLAAGGKHNNTIPADPDHPYLCNGLPLTLEEAALVYAYGIPSRNITAGQYVQARCRTHLPSPLTKTVSCGDVFAFSALEVINLPCLLVGQYCFSYCGNLREVTCNCPNYSGIGHFNMCHELRTLRCSYLRRSSLFLGSARHLTADTLRHLIDRIEEGTTAFTITVHADVYKNLSEGLVTVEWDGIIAAAAAKNCTIACA